MFRTIIDPSVTNEISYSFHCVPCCYSFSYTQANLWSEGHMRMQQPHHDDCRMVCSHRNGRRLLGVSTWARRHVCWLWTSEAERVEEMAHAVFSLRCDFLAANSKVPCLLVVQISECALQSLPEDAAEIAYGWKGATETLRKTFSLSYSHPINLGLDWIKQFAWHWCFYLEGLSGKNVWSIMIKH